MHEPISQETNNPGQGKAMNSTTQRKKISSRNAIAAAVAVLAVAGGVALIQVSANANTPPAAAQGAPVDVAEVVARKVVDWQSYSGRLEAVDRVEIRPLVSGTLTAVHFKDGTVVRKGDALFTIDPRPYATEVARAQAQVVAAEARAAYTASGQARAPRRGGKAERRARSHRQPARRPGRAGDRQAQPRLHAHHRAAEHAGVRLAHLRLLRRR